eukprot:4547733-Pyramimonas_sp.AAC.1
MKLASIKSMYESTDIGHNVDVAGLKLTVGTLFAEYEEINNLVKNFNAPRRSIKRQASDPIETLQAQSQAPEDPSSLPIAD